MWLYYGISLLYDFLSSDFFSSLNFGQVTDRQTDIQIAMHMSPLCIRTGGLNKMKHPYLIQNPKGSTINHLGGGGWSGFSRSEFFFWLLTSIDQFWQLTLWSVFFLEMLRTNFVVFFNSDPAPPPMINGRPLNPQPKTIISICYIVVI